MKRFIAHEGDGKRNHADHDHASAGGGKGRSVDVSVRRKKIVLSLEQGEDVDKRRTYAGDRLRPETAARV